MAPRPTLRFVRAPSVVDHALHALLVLAEAPPGESRKIRELCADGERSRKFVAAALGDLRRVDIVRSRRGSNGGYWLSRPADRISVAEVFDAVDVRPPTEVPGADAPLALWTRVEAEVRAGFSATTIADLAAGRPADAG